MMLRVSNSREWAGKALALLASYLKATQFELKVLLLIEQLLQPIGQDDVGVVEAAILLVKLVVLIVFHTSWHAVVGHRRILLIHIVATCVDEAPLGVGVIFYLSICRACLHPTAN